MSFKDGTMGGEEGSLSKPEATNDPTNRGALTLNRTAPTIAADDTVGPMLGMSPVITSLCCCIYEE